MTSATPATRPRSPQPAPAAAHRPGHANRRAPNPLTPTPAIAGRAVTGAQSLVRSLEAVGVRGGLRHPRRHDPARPTTRCSTPRRCGTSWSATSRARATRPPGTRRPPARSASAWRPPGPGATNLVTPLADAHMDSVPVVAITGQAARALIGTDAFQEADICGITLPITKHNFLVTDPAEIPRAIAEAFHLASHRPTRPGAGRHPQGRAAGADHLLLAARSCGCPATGRPPGRTASRSARPPS